MSTSVPTIYTVVDTETTGLRAVTGRIIDIGIIRIEDGIVTKRFSSLVHPGFPLSSITEEITGITDADLIDAPRFEDIALEVQELFKDSVFVAHNAPFDYSFVKAEFARLGITFTASTLCTVKLSRSLYPTQRKHDLDTVMNTHGLVCDTRHRAYPDAQVVEQFLLKHWKENKVGFDSIITTQLYGESVPLLFERTILKDLPDTSGVYFFYGAERELLYVGKSKNIRTRVRSHFSSTSIPKEKKLCQQTVSVEATTTHGELSALLLEAHLIKKELPHFNRATRHQSELVTCIESTDEEGYKRAVIGRTQSITPDTTILGVFRSLAQAKTSLRAIASDCTLCEKLLGIDTTKGACFGMQIGKCLGACIQKESVEDYNKRFTECFAKKRLRTWPYTGPIMINEKGIERGKGTMFLIDNWVLKGSFVYDHAEVSHFLPVSDSFDYDTYKLLARFITNRSNRSSISTLTEQEYRDIMRRATGDYDDTIVYD